MKIENVLTLRDVLKYCKRASGRTTNIIKALIPFLSDESKEQNKHYVIVTCNRQMTEEYVRVLKKAFMQYNKNVMFNNNNNTIVNNISNNKITFLNSDGSVISYAFLEERLQGVRCNDVIFDTPEINLLKDACLQTFTYRLK